MKAYVCLVVFASVCAIGAGLAAKSPAMGDFSRAGLLLLLSVVYDVIEARVDKLRLYLGGDGQYIDASGVWCFAAALILPPGLACVMVAVLYGVATIRDARSETAIPPHRTIFTGATVVLAVVAARGAVAGASLVHHSVNSGVVMALGTLLAVGTYLLVNQTLVSTVVYLVTRPTHVRDVIHSRSELSTELVTLLCGVFAAQTLVSTPWLTPTVLALIVVLHRSSLATQFREAASTDGKTGLLNAITWQELARRQLIRSEREGRAASVLLVDLDYFKLVNDVHGHQAGDIALKVVADALKAELRGYDGVGRYGGEEFVAFLDGADVATAGHAAERINQRIRDLRITLADGSELTVTASIGTASFPGDGLELDDLIAGADSALYAAKEAGRDCVRHFSDPRDGRRASVHQH